MKLTDKQILFVTYYLEDLNAARAAERAGYSKRAARNIGSENLTKPYIQEEIERQRLELQRRSELTTDLVINELRALGFYSIETFIETNNRIKDLTTLTTDQLKPVIGIKVTEKITTIGDVTEKTITTDLKLSDKRGSLVDLGRHLGIFDKDNKQKKIKIKVTRK
ncbi:terminase small subunit [Niabella insulamsoli]|uniref:terminase small subunit n=1 Tax=Niabella insulamsoli TaxID=3144874 RepID=UPI0031FBD2C5